MSKDIIVALDKSTWDDNWNVVEALPDHDWFKIGPIFYLQYPTIVRELKVLNKKVMLDLKFHDIPNTVKGSCAEAARMGADMLTIHLSGGRDMIEAAMEGADGKVDVLGISVLTSHDDRSLEEVGFTPGYATVLRHVQNLVSLGKECNIEGIVCSAQETQSMREKFGYDLLIINPGVRVPAKDDVSDDQKRITTPKEAFNKGANFIVMGRQIINAPDPADFLEKVKASLND